MFQKTVLRFGLILGAISVALTFAVVPLLERRAHGAADLIGYASMVLSALFVFFGIRSYRETAGEGRITFRRALGVGVAITLVSCACSVVGCEVLYFLVAPQFGDTFAACMVERAQATGATPEQVAQVTEQAALIKRLYDNPLMNAVMTFALTFPVGLAGSLLSALILRRR